MKILSGFIFIFFIYWMPLVSAPTRLHSYKIVVLAIFCILFFTSQPAIKTKEAQKNKETDRRTVYLILWASALSQLAVIVEYGHFASITNDKVLGACTIAGSLLLFGGTFFRILAIRTLGKYFTATVSIQSDQQIITAGPYAFLRHPSYLGAYLAFIGSALFMGTPVASIITILLMLLAYKIRIEAEEKALISTFGEMFKDYQKTTFSMFPYIW